MQSTHCTELQTIAGNAVLVRNASYAFRLIWVMGTEDRPQKSQVGSTCCKPVEFLKHDATSPVQEVQLLYLTQNLCPLADEQHMCSVCCLLKSQGGCCSDHVHGWKSVNKTLPTPK